MEPWCYCAALRIVCFLDISFFYWRNRIMLRFKLRWLAAVVCLSMLSASLPVWADEKAGARASEVVDQIKDEGLNRSQVMQTLSYLSDVIGARLTASPNAKRA